MMRTRGEMHRFIKAIGRSVQESDRGSISTFNDISPGTIDEARKALRNGGRFAACEYLRFFVAEQDGGDAEDFCEDVIEGGADATAWRIEDCLVGVVERDREAVTLTIAQYVAILDGLVGERWFRATWNDLASRGIPLPGAGPGTLIRAMRYWTPFDVPNPNAAIRRMVVDPKSRIVEHIPDGDIDVAIRRWMASVAAWWAHEYLLSEGPHVTVEGIIAAYPEPVTPSSDGIVALGALAREARSGDPRWPGHVGFIGPDDWYRP